MATKATEEKELNLDQKVTVKSIAGWNTGFSRKDGIGDIGVPPHGNFRVSRNEIIMQVQSGNVLFTGSDKYGANGSHATYYIMDEPTRIEVGFESADGKTKQPFINEDVVKKLIKKSNNDFEKSITDLVKTRAEKSYIMEIVSKLNVNDFAKVRFLEEYTGIKIK